MIAGSARGLDFQAMTRMSLGQIVDYCVEYDNQTKRSEKRKDEPEVRKASRGDFSSIFG